MFLVLVLALSCGRKAKVIPRSDLADIYFDVLLADQWAKDDIRIRRVADTSLFYERIFNKYGYTTDDYIASVDYYMHDPERFARILAKVSKRLDKEAAKFRKIHEHNEKVRRNKENAHALVEKMLDRFSDDSLYKGAFVVRADSCYEMRIVAYPSDTSFSGPEIIIRLDTLSASADSISAMSDSLLVASDSLGTGKDTVAKKGLMSNRFGEDQEEVKKAATLRSNEIRKRADTIAVKPAPRKGLAKKDSSK